ncbi:MAG: hypothetical protein ABJE66_16560 [Deltaproteobacteria bacterium]
MRPLRVQSFEIRTQRSARDAKTHIADTTSNGILGKRHRGVVRYLAVMLDPKGVVIDRVWKCRPRSRGCRPISAMLAE